VRVVEDEQEPLVVIERGGERVADAAQKPVARALGRRGVWVAAESRPSSGTNAHSSPPAAAASRAPGVVVGARQLADAAEPGLEDRDRLARAARENDDRPGGQRLLGEGRRGRWA